MDYIVLIVVLYCVIQYIFLFPDVFSTRNTVILTESHKQKCTIKLVKNTVSFHSIFPVITGGMARLPFEVLGKIVRIGHPDTL